MVSFKIGNKLKRQEQYVKQKREKESTKRDERHRRRRNEDKNPHLREQRRKTNVPETIDKKRTWDEVDLEAADDGAIGLSVDVLNPKKRKIDERGPQAGQDGGHGEAEAGGDEGLDGQYACLWLRG